jgi:hypothetical protein
MTHPIASCSAVLGLILVSTARAAPASAQGGQAAITIGDATVVESTGPNSVVAFTVRLTGAPPTGVTVTFSTAPGTATGGSSCVGSTTDYLTVGPTPLSLTPADTVKRIHVTVCGHPREEPDEAFVVNLVNSTLVPIGATISDAQGRATIVNDDQQPHVRIADATIVELRTTDYRIARLSVTLSAPSPNTVRLTPVAVNRTAVGGAICGDGVDYETGELSGDALAMNPVSFEPGDTIEDVTVRVCGDVVPEPDEQFEVRLSGTGNAIIDDGIAVVTIMDDDASTLSIADAGPVAEPSVPLPQPARAVFVVTVGGAAPTQPVSVQYATSSGTAAGGAACLSALGPDFVAQTGTLTFTPGSLLT